MPERYDDIRSMIKSKRVRNYSRSPKQENDRFDALLADQKPETSETVLKKSQYNARSSDDILKDLYANHEIDSFIRYLNSVLDEKINDESELEDLLEGQHEYASMLYDRFKENGSMFDVAPQSVPDTKLEYSSNHDTELPGKAHRDLAEAYTEDENGKINGKVAYPFAESAKETAESPKSESESPKSESKPPKNDSEEAQDDFPAPDQPDSGSLDGEIDYSELGEIFAAIEDALGKDVTQEIFDIVMEHLDDDEFEAVMEAKEEAESDTGAESGKNKPEMEPFDGGATVIHMGIEGDDEPDESDDEDEGYVSIRECIDLRKSGNKNASYRKEIESFRKATPPPSGSPQEPNQTKNNYNTARQAGGRPQHEPNPLEQQEQQQQQQDEQDKQARMESYRQRRQARAEQEESEGARRNEAYRDANPKFQERMNEALDMEDPYEAAKKKRAQGQANPNPGQPSTDEAFNRATAWSNNARTTMEQRAQARTQDAAKIKEDAAAQAKAKADAEKESAKTTPTDNGDSRAAATQASRNAMAQEKTKIMQEKSDAWNKQYGTNAGQAAAGQARAGGGNNYYSLLGPRMNGQPGLLSRLMQAIRNWRLNRARVTQAGQAAAAQAAQAPQQNQGA
jgi:hypothetical protein